MSRGSTATALGTIGLLAILVASNLSGLGPTPEPTFDRAGPPPGLGTADRSVPARSASPASPASRPAASGTVAPRPATRIDPLAGYSREPAPVGIADFGVTGTGSGAAAYSYATDAFVGQATIDSMTVNVATGSGTTHVMAFELNEMLILRAGSTNFTYWVQNGLHVDASTGEFTIGGAYVWNFSSPTAHLNSTQVSGRAGSSFETDTYYYVPGCGVFAGQCGTLSWPTSLSGRVFTATSAGLPYIDYQYDLGSGWVTYDNVTFPALAGATDLGFVVDGYAPTPYAAHVYYDAEWDWVGAGGGVTATDEGSNVSLALEYWNGANYQEVPTAWNFGGDTGEMSTNVTDELGGADPGGALSAHLVSGAGSLGVLYNLTDAGYLNVTEPNGSAQTIEVGGVPTTFAGGTANLTLAPGTYSFSLENYSGTPASATVVAGRTTYLDLSDAGRVTLEEQGLPGGTTWGFTLAGQLFRSSSATISTNLPNGAYPIAYSGVPGFFANATDARTVDVPSSSVWLVVFDAVTYPVPVEELGLPTGTGWWVGIGATVVRGDGPTITVSAANGSTPYVVGGPYEFLAVPSRGNLSVAGGVATPVEVAFEYRPTFIAGTVSPADAQVTIGGAAVSIAGGAFNVSVVPGPYTIVASASGYTSETYQVNATAGNVTVQTISLRASPAETGGRNPASNGAAPTILGLPVVEFALLAGAAAVAIALLALWKGRRRGSP